MVKRTLLIYVSRLNYLYTVNDMHIKMCLTYLKDFFCCKNKIVYQNGII